ncbi:MAG: putative transcriptional regulator [Thermomicrobiales bacterium]|nr:putative transcriptional regulator [Thermomicrobiales bacterium]
MPPTRWDQRFFASTRGRVVTLLRDGHTTVEDLARALNLTDNAVRTHLSALERDGLVVQSGLRRGVGKPAYTYVLTPDAERLFPKAYGALLQLMLDILAERLPPEALDDLLRDMGHRLAAKQPVPVGDLRARVEDAVGVLGELGGLAGHVFSPRRCWPTLLTRQCAKHVIRKVCAADSRSGMQSANVVSIRHPAHSHLTCQRRSASGSMRENVRWPAHP